MPLPERLLGPVDEVETVFIAPVFDGAVLVERVGIEATALDGQRVVHHQLRRHDRIDHSRVAALRGNRIAQTCQVHERRLAQDVMTDHACREPREVEVALAFDDLLERGAQRHRVATSHEVFGQHARGVGQRVIGARLDRLDRGTRVEEIQLGARQGFAVCSVHTVGA
jgi:hypothetical protein